MSSKSAARYQHLVKLFSDASLPIIIEDLEGTVVAMNPAAEEAYGWENDELLGHPIKTIVPPELYGHADDLLRRCREGQIVRDVEGIRQHRDGTKSPVLLTLSLLRDESGEPSSIASMATDISALKAAQRDLHDYKDHLERRVAERTAELESALTHLDQARAAADRANRAKSEFLANMSHEIRTPMNAVLGMTHLCLETELSSKQASYLKKIESSARNLLGLVDNILDFSKIEAGKLSLEDVPFELGAVLDHQRDLFSLTAARKGLELLFEVEPCLPKVFRGDAMRLGQILTNLLANAIKFTEQGVIRLAVTSQKVQHNTTTLNFGVSDTGIGVDSDEIQSLFESFSQADTSTTRRYGGTGLGLAICNQLVQLMGGRLGADSQLGQGSLFWFEIELQACASQNEPALPFQSKSVLLVDSLQVSRDHHQELLQNLGCLVTACGDLETAGSLLQSEGEPDLLILCDRPELWEQASQSGIFRERLPGRSKLLVLTEFGSPLNPACTLPASLLARPVLSSHLETSLERLFFEVALPTQHGHKLGLARQFPSLSGLRILVVEDNPINREVLGEILSKVGVKVTEAKDGESAVRTAREKTFDLILMDIQMPGLDGPSSSRVLRSEGLKTPIIAVSANVSPADRERYKLAGMNDFVAKPIEPYQLCSIMQRWVASREILDESLALRTLMGNETLFHTLMKDFLEEYDSMERNFPTTDRKAARIYAHSLAGSAANLGLKQLAARAKKLEEACLMEAELNPFLNSVLEAINSVQLTYRSGKRKIIKMPPKPSQVSVKFATLESSLKSGDASSLALLHGFLGGLETTERPAYQELVEMVEGFEFELALDWLQSRAV